MSARLTAIDGPANAGKSTLAAELAKRLGVAIVNTGSIYRIGGYLAHGEGLDLTNDATCAEFFAGLDLYLANGLILVNGEDFSSQLRSPQASVLSKAVAKLPSVREVVRGVQRLFVEQAGGRAVVEGRDIGTVVFPEADLKLWLDASPACREYRAYRVQLARGSSPEVAREEARRIMARDAEDAERHHSPMVAPTDAITFMNEFMTTEEAVETLHGIALLPARARPSRVSARRVGGRIYLEQQ